MIQKDTFCHIVYVLMILYLYVIISHYLLCNYPHSFLDKIPQVCVL